MSDDGWIAAPGGRSRGRASPPGAVPSAFRLDGLLLLGGGHHHPVVVDGISLTFDGSGVGVASDRADQPRVLPWSSLSTHAVEQWAGGELPEWWAGTGSDGGAPGATGTADPHLTGSPVPATTLRPGALISLQTPFATYRFLLPGGDAAGLAPRMAALALAHQGASGVSAVTTARVVDGQVGPAGTRSRWKTIQPFAVVLLVLVLGAAATVILLQSAGTIHLPFLGGAAPGTVSSLRTP